MFAVVVGPDNLHQVISKCPQQAENDFGEALSRASNDEDRVPHFLGGWVSFFEFCF